jgi:hypothetical protein
MGRHLEQEVHEVVLTLLDDAQSAAQTGRPAANRIA